MPTLSASDYTTFLKYKAAAASPIRAAIQTRDNVATSISLINANILASQAAFVAAPTTSTVRTITATVTTARTDIITGTYDPGSASIGYDTSQPHGLLAGDSVSITGLGQGSLIFDPNLEGATIVSAPDPNKFVIVVGVSASGNATGTGSITGRVYYTTSSAHGLAVGDVISVSGLSTFGVSGATVLAVPSSTTFVLASTTTGTAEEEASGVLTYTRSVPVVSVNGLARVQPVPVVQQRATATAKSTVSFAGTSGALSSSRLQRPGGLPTGFKNSQGTYTRLPQSAGW